MNKLKLYDFDGTIYDGDSSVDLLKYAMHKKKTLYFRLPIIAFMYLKHKMKLITITEFKEYVFSYVKYFNIDNLVEEFWQKHKHKIKDFYLSSDHSEDIIVSASPYFLLKPICKELKVKDLIASDVNKENGHFNKPNNHGHQKIVELKRKYHNFEVLEMYSDSLNDKPLLDIAEKAYMVKKNKIIDYKDYKPSKLKLLLRNDEIISYIIYGALTTLVSISAYGICSKLLRIPFYISNVISWTIAVVFAYFVNKKYVFESNSKKKIESVKFIISRLLTLGFENLAMYVMIEMISIDDLISKIIVQFLIVILNYLLSKLIVFKKGE